MSPSVADGTPVPAVPADAAGHGLLTRPPPGPARGPGSRRADAAAQAGAQHRRIAGSPGPGPAGHGRLGLPDADAGSWTRSAIHFAIGSRQMMATNRNEQSVIS